MEKNELKVVKKINNFVLTGKILSSVADIQDIKEALAPVTAAIEYYEIVTKQNKDFPDTIAYPRTLVAGGGVTLAVKDFVNNKIVKDLL